MLVYNVNIRGLLKNWNMFKKQIENKKPDIITLQEVFTKKLMFLKNYKLFYKHRSFYKGGGLCTYVRKNLYSYATKFHMDNNINDKNFEILVVKIKKVGKSELKIINIYINPKCNANISDMFKEMDINNDTLILGDFNSKYPEWCLSGKTNKKGIILSKVIENNDLTIHNKKIKTLINNFGESSTVDLVITKRISSISIDRVVSINDIGSDHIPILCQVSCDVSEIKKTYYNYKKIKINKFICMLKSHLLYFCILSYIYKDPNKLYNAFCNIYLKCQNDCVPKKVCLIAVIKMVTFGGMRT